MTHCQLGATLEEALRDRFVCGLRHTSIQWRLLSEQELTYVKALDITRAMEAADSNTKAFKATEPAIHKFTRQAYKLKLAKEVCYRCGRRSHSPAECRFREFTCHHCNKKGTLHRSLAQRHGSRNTSKPAGGHKQR